MRTQRRRGAILSRSHRVLFGLACAIAILLAPTFLARVPAQATGAGTWSLDGGPAHLGFGEVDAISCADPTYCVALSSNQYEEDSLILEPAPGTRFRWSKRMARCSSTVCPVSLSHFASPSVTVPPHQKAGPMPWA